MFAVKLEVERLCGVRFGGKRCGRRRIRGVFFRFGRIVCGHNLHGFLRRFRNRFVCRFLGGQIGRLRLCGFWVGWLRRRLRREFLRLHGLLARQQFVDHIVLQQKCRPGHERDHRQHEQRGEKAVLVPFALAAAHLALVHRARHADRLRAGRFFQCLFLLILFHGSLSIVSKLLPCIITQNRGFVNP